MVFLHRGQAFSAGFNGNYGEKMEITSDYWVNTFLKNCACECQSHKAQTICDLQTQQHCIKLLGVSDQRSKYS